MRQRPLGKVVGVVANDRRGRVLGGVDLSESEITTAVHWHKHFRCLLVRIPRHIIC